jgi:hypothetical protein
MSERIKELGNKAWHYADQNSRDGDGTFGHLYRDKLAELIVRECCNEIAQEPFNAGAASKWLQKHFGIKE